MVCKSLLERVKDNIDRYGLIPSGGHVIAGLSGGADSVFLLHALHSLNSILSFKITAVHVNHMLRGRESDEDQGFCEALCAELGVPLRVFSEDIAARAEALRISQEEAGREARYGLFNKVLKEVGADAIAVAHNLEDRAETVMMNILRGCGLEGLSGMDYKNGVIVRPLLDISRGDIEAYLEEKGQSYRIDSSNYTNAYFRNRIRNQLFPFIRDNLGTDPVQSLLRLSHLAGEDQGFLEETARQVFGQYVNMPHPQELFIDRDCLNGMNKAVSSRIIRLSWEKLKGDKRNLESIHVNQILKLSRTGGPHGTISLPGGFTAWVDYKKLHMGVKCEEEAPKDYAYELQIPGITEAHVAGGRMIAELLDEKDIKTEEIREIKENSSFQLFDYLKLDCGINIRNRRAGDRFFPCGSPGKKKLKEYLIDTKVPLEKRNVMPLVARDQEILWVIGMRTSQKIKPDSRTRQYVKLTWVPYN
jgi:tRNA(Ile)-lysidine synthase